MANPSGVVVAAALVLTALIIAMSSTDVVEASGDNHHNLSWAPQAKSSGCLEGSMAECMAASEEFEMESEINRRILQAATQYISYGALQRNTVPCSQRGASYYNCQPGAQANPYSRGCSAITRCRS